MMKKYSIKKIDYSSIYINTIVKRKYSIVILSWLLFILAMYYGLNTFSGLDDGGFYASKSESAKVSKQFGINGLIAPDYSITVLTEGLNDLTTDDNDFKIYYNL